MTFCPIGHWLYAIGTKYSTCQGNKYVGIDINAGLFPMFPGPQFEFYKHNIAHSWPPEEHNSFDLVHQRLSLPGAAPAPLPQAVKNLFALVKPGGWIQLVEAEQIAPGSGPVFLEFLELVRAVFVDPNTKVKSDKGLKNEGAVLRASFNVIFETVSPLLSSLSNFN